jgi:DNA-binding transcriptional LysR family regulator
VDRAELVGEVIFREELVVLTAPSIKSFEHFVRAGDVRMIVLRAGCSYRERLEALLANRGIPAPRQLEFGTLEAIFGCVEAGLGITLLPKDLVGPVLRQGRVAAHELPPKASKVETLFIRRRGGFVSSALAAFLRLTEPDAEVRSRPQKRNVLSGRR